MEFLKPEFALEILVNIRENFPKPLSDLWGEDVIQNPFVWFEAAQKEAESIGARYLSVYFNIDDDVSKIDENLALLEKIQAFAKMPLIIRGTGQKGFDAKFLPRVAEKVNKPSIIAFAQDLNYEPIVKSILKNPIKDDIRLVLRAPIDINLTKELNILCEDLGFPSKNIIMDTDTGCVGMGLDYGYSIIERLVIARDDGDEVLGPPIIVFSGEESFKSKESKSDDFKDSRGSLEIRSAAIETATSTALLCAGANIIVCQNPKTVKTLSSLLFGGSFDKNTAVTKDVVNPETIAGYDGRGL